MAKRVPYSLTDEHRAQLRPWAERWIRNALSTEPMTDADREWTTRSIHGLYAAANLPAPKCVLYVASPITAAIAAGVASGAIYAIRHPERHRQIFGRQVTTEDVLSAITHACAIATVMGRRALDLAVPVTALATASATAEATDSATALATRSATRAAIDSATAWATAEATASATAEATASATLSATRSATELATLSATESAIRAATDSATLSATLSATRSATDSATESAIRAATASATASATLSAAASATELATLSATNSATNSATDSATDSPICRFLLSCVAAINKTRNNGNMWSAWCSYLSFFDRVCGLDLPEYERWRHYEAAALHSGPRYMHADFCIVSDRPTTIGRDAQDRAHCETGPQIAWSDGWESYSWHGTRVPPHWITARSSMTAQEVLAQSDVEVRRAGCEIMGWGKILADLPHKAIDADADPEIGTLIHVDLPDAPGSAFLIVRCGTGRDGIPLPVPATCETAIEANAWTYSIPKDRAHILRRRQVRT